MKNEEGLRYPSIDNLLTKIDSKYKLAYASAKRAKILKEDDYTSIDTKSSKPVGIALEEIIADKVKIEFK
jgi:DNA-directed RNA polymerase subunit omega